MEWSGGLILGEVWLFDIFWMVGGEGRWERGLGVEGRGGLTWVTLWIGGGGGGEVRGRGGLCRNEGG